MWGNYTAHQEQKLIKLYQVRKHFFEAEKINNALYSMEHLKTIKLLKYLRAWGAWGSYLLPCSMSYATRPLARAGAARKVKPKPLSVCSKCALVFDQMTQPACMTWRHALSWTEHVITPPGSATNLRKAHTTKDFNIFKLSLCPYVSSASILLVGCHGIRQRISICASMLWANHHLWCKSYFSLPQETGHASGTSLLWVECSY